MAYDLIHGERRFIDEYTSEDFKHFVDYLEMQLQKIELSCKDVPFLRDKMLQMYANPLINHLAALEE